MPSSGQEWADDVLQILKTHNISIVATVPDAGLSRLLELCRADPCLRVVTLSSEQEGIGMGLGAWLGHGRLLLCMQSSGTGNCINALALPAVTQTPCLMLITMRGESGETNPWQVPMGRAVRPVLDAMNVNCMEAKTADQVKSLLDQAAKLAFHERQAVALLIHQSVLGVKRFDE